MSLLGFLLRRRVAAPASAPVVAMAATTAPTVAPYPYTSFPRGRRPTDAEVEAIFARRASSAAGQALAH